uniref:hypothetical protein n=1 Tax=Aeromicrobium sp. TaxID=1871063 RepID=UPI0028A80F92
MASVPPETRAQVARRRLAELAANFDASLPGPPAEESETTSAARPRRSLRPVHVRFIAIVGGVAAVLTVWWLVAG